MHPANEQLFMEAPMPKDPQQSSSALTTDTPVHPIISDDSHRDTLDRVAHVIELLKELDLSEGLTPSARAGLYWIHCMLADTVKHVSDGLK
jgi:hypothetical protein